MSRRREVGLAGAVLTVALLVGAVSPGDSPLLDASKRGDIAAVKALLAQGADPNAARGDGLSALHLTAEEGNLEIVRLLLDAGADVAAKTHIGHYQPLHLASRTGQADVVRVLLAAGADPEAVTTTTGVTPLHLAAKALDGAGAVRVLLEHGAPIDARESAAGQTPLMFAASFGRVAAIRKLLGHGADPSLRTDVTDALQGVAIDFEAHERLLQAVAEIRRSSEGGTDRALTPSEVQAAIASQRQFLQSNETIEEFLEDFSPDDLARLVPSWVTQSDLESDVQVLLRPEYETLVGKVGGMTALLHAARDGRIEAAQALLDGGADIDQVSGDGTSPLVMALLNGRFDLAMRLIERGADPNLVTHDDGMSALFAVLQTQWALRFTHHPQPRAHDNQQTEYIDVLEALLAAGADPNVRLKTDLFFFEYTSNQMGLDVTGATPFWRAAMALDIEAMKALAAHGADPSVPTMFPEPGMSLRRRTIDGRQQDDSGLPIQPEGTPDAYPIHAAAGVGYMGLGAFYMDQVPNNFLNAVKYLVDEHGADVNVPDGWAYTPLHYASVRGDNEVIEYLVAQGADVRAISSLGQSVADMARGGRAGYFSRTAYPETAKLLQDLGSPLRCLDTMFRGTGDYCPGVGVEPFETVEQQVGSKD